jgi:hypothetical protein
VASHRLANGDQVLDSRWVVLARWRYLSVPAPARVAGFAVISRAGRPQLVKRQAVTDDANDNTLDHHALCA